MSSVLDANRLEEVLGGNPQNHPQFYSSHSLRMAEQYGSYSRNR
jgi:hypothetical protein